MRSINEKLQFLGSLIVINEMFEDYYDTELSKSYKGGPAIDKISEKFGAEADAMLTDILEYPPKKFRDFFEYQQGKIVEELRSDLGL